MSIIESILFVSIYSLLSLNFSSCTPNGPCTPLNSCQCVFPSGATLDLSKFHPGTKIIDVSNAANNSFKVLYAPCENVIVLDPSSTINGCEKGVSVCIINNNTFIDGGRSEEIQFPTSTFQDVPMNIEFKKSGWTTTFQVDCNVDAGPNNSLSVSQFDPGAKILTLKLKSNDVCIGFNTSGGYGFFSTLFMVLLLGFTGYFVGGALLLKFLRGAEGVEMIPNYEFWRNFPQHCKSGVSYCLNRCQATTTYENI